jgi:hypothetical protein
MEVRNLANQILAEDEKPKDWDFFTKPLVDKCRLLLQVPPLCPKPPPSQSQHKLLAAALLVKKRSSKSPKAPSSWDAVMTSVHAAKVYTR